MNNFHPKINFSHEINKESIHFFVLDIRLSDCKISTDLYVKSKDRHQFLHHTLSHTDHTKRSIVFGQVLRVSEICSKKSDFLKHLEQMKSWLLVRGYSQDLIEAGIKKLTFTDKTDPFDLLKKEDYWRSTLKTMALFGINIGKVSSSFITNILVIICCYFCYYCFYHHYYYHFYGCHYCL